MAICCLLSTTWAQETITYDFEDGQMPAEFTLINADGLTPNQPDDVVFADSAWIVIESGLLESFAALSISWYVDDAGPADDWMILPKFMLGDGAMLNWTAQSTTSSGDFPDSYQVLLNTGAPTLEDFAENGVVLQEFLPEEFENAQMRSIDLSDFAGQEVHIAFRNVTPSGDALLIDDIELTQVVTTSTQAVSPAAFQMQLLPNPATQGIITLSYQLESAADVQVEVRNIAGSLLANYPQGMRAAGVQQLQLPVQQLSSGVYLVSLTSGTQTATQRLIIK